MKLAVGILMVIFFCVGCQAVETIKTEHLKADEWQEDIMVEARETLKKDYWGIPETKVDRQRKKEIEGIAQNALIDSPHENDYQLWTSVIDQDPGIPEAFSYYFVNFLPFEDRSDLVDTSYVVVINRYTKAVVYSGVFTPPGGDSFYRYHQIIEEIKGR